MAVNSIDDIFASEEHNDLDLMHLFNEDENKDKDDKKDSENAEECGKSCQSLAFENFNFDEQAFLADADDDIEDDTKNGAKADISDLDKGDDDKDDKKKDDDDKDDKKKDDDEDKKGDDDKKDDDKKDDDKDDKSDNASKNAKDGDECFKFDEVDEAFASSEEFYDVFNDEIAAAPAVDPEDDAKNPDDTPEDDDENKDDKKGKKDSDEEVVGLGDGDGADDDLKYESALFGFLDD